MRSQGQGSHSKKTRNVSVTFAPQRAGSGAAGEPAARAHSIAEALRAATGAGCDPRGCWAMPRPFTHRPEKLRELSTLERCSRESQALDASARSLAITPNELDSGHDVGDEHLDSTFGEGLKSPPSYLNLINNFCKPENLRQAERNLKEKTLVEMRELNKQIKQAQIQQEPLLKDNRQLHTEKLLVQAENKFFLEYLTNKTEEYRRQPEKVWNTYVQKCGEIEQRRQESASRYEQQTSLLKTELLQKEKIQSNLKQQLQAMRDISILRETQELEIQTLQEEEKKFQAEAAAKKQKVQVQFLQEKAFLEKQLSEPDIRQLEKRKRREHKRNAQALELAAKQSIFEFTVGIIRENQQLQTKLLQLTQQSQILEATQSQLKNWKQQLQQEQWYVECLIRGRQGLQGRHNWCLKEQDAPKTTSSPPLGTKSRINPK
ncbi:coiled-coil domain-containing protein 121 [Lemur catta]|uniref:coiled-coil domain-containing protein 121 n=1 Tax=Lemur catta TaxID=9447 RepID=UPI001E269282|nr:coiled-coil domain-containing protein 121 [Lemur catta]